MSVIRVGTAGWMYKDWEGIVYPPPRRDFDRLGFMASLFDINEINSTFYRIPPASMARDWARRVSHNERFLFTAKLYRGFTHDGNATAGDEKAVGDAMGALASAERLGAVLVQVPMSFRASEENRAILERIFKRFAAFPLAAEFRHFSWNNPETLRFLEDNSVGFVNIDQPLYHDSIGPTAHATSHVGYVRVHGRNYKDWFRDKAPVEQRYNYLYRPDELEPWAERAKEIAADPATREVYVVTNNHYKGKAVANALMLKSMVTGAVAPAPSGVFEAYGDVMEGYADPRPEGSADASLLTTSP